MVFNTTVEINSTHARLAAHCRRWRRAFEAVARLGSLSRAAVELNVTKSAVGHQLRALESDLGATLLAGPCGGPR